MRAILFVFMIKGWKGGKANMSAELIFQIYRIASLVFSVLTIILSVLTIIMKKSKSKKVQEIASQLEQTTSNVIAVKNIILDFMKQAEQFINYTGSDKKSWVITKTKEYCMRNEIAYDDSLIEATIESLIEFSKSVNAPDEKVIEMVEQEKIKESASNGVKRKVTLESEKEIKVNG